MTAAPTAAVLLIGDEILSGRTKDKNLGLMLAGLSPSEQAQFFHRWETPGLHASLRLGMQHGKDKQEVAAASSFWSKRMPRRMWRKPCVIMALR